MSKVDELEKLQKLKESGAISEDEFIAEKNNILSNSKENNKKGNKKIIIFVLIIIGILIAGLLIVFLGKNTLTENGFGIEKETIKQTSSNIYTGEVSFANMKSDDKNFSETQQEIIKYFDNNYFDLKISESIRYPQIFKGAKVTTDAVVVKVLKSNDKEFEVLAVQGGGLGYDFNGGALPYDHGYGNMPIEELPEEQLFILKGKQLSQRLIKGDVITVYGRYIDVETKDIEGKTYTIPNINLMNIIQLSNDTENNYRFNFKTIKTVAEFIFGKDIKINKPAQPDSIKEEVSSAFNPYYEITLDNQSNANFSIFNIYRSSGSITYNLERSNITSNIEKGLFVGADFQHYIVITYDYDLKYIYIDYFNNEFKKIWSREFECHSNKDGISIPIDYTNEMLSIVVENDFYLLDIETGENIFEPITVGEKVGINMMEDGVFLVGDDNKDTFTKIDYKGKIIFKKNSGTNMVSILAASLQIVNDKMVVCLFGENEDDIGISEKYLVLNSDGTIETSTKEFVSV